MQLARVHSNTLSQSLFLGKALPSHDSGLSLTINEKERRLQQIQLYVYVLELLYSVLQLTQEMLKEGRVIPSRPLIRGQPLCLVDLWIHSVHCFPLNVFLVLSSMVTFSGIDSILCRWIWNAIAWHMLVRLKCWFSGFFMSYFRQYTLPFFSYMLYWLLSQLRRNSLYFLAYEKVLLVTSYL